MPGYVARHGDLKAKGVDEIWCVATNDAFVMGAWGKDQKTDGKVRMLGDGNAELTKKGDLFIPADDSYLKVARAKNLIAESIPLARMSPVLAVAKGNPKGIHSLGDLLKEQIGDR